MEKIKNANDLRKVVKGKTMYLPVETLGGTLSIRVTFEAIKEAIRDIEKTTSQWEIIAHEHDNLIKLVILTNITYEELKNVKNENNINININ